MPLAKRRSEQENVFTTNNTRPNQKINRLNQSALILTQGLTKATLQCTVKPLFFFFLTKSQPFNKKQPTGTINHIKRSEKTIPATTQLKTTKKQTFKTNTTSNYEKMQCFWILEYPDGNFFRTNHKYAFYKNSTQIHKTAGVTTVWNKVQQPRKSNILYF